MIHIIRSWNKHIRLALCFHGASSAINAWRSFWRSHQAWGISPLFYWLFKHYKQLIAYSDMREPVRVRVFWDVLQVFFTLIVLILPSWDVIDWLFRTKALKHLKVLISDLRTFSLSLIVIKATIQCRSRAGWLWWMRSGTTHSWVLSWWSSLPI